MYEIDINWNEYTLDILLLIYTSSALCENRGYNLNCQQLARNDQCELRYNHAQNKENCKRSCGYCGKSGQSKNTTSTLKRWFLYNQAFETLTNFQFNFNEIFACLFMHLDSVVGK